MEYNILGFLSSKALSGYELRSLMVNSTAMFTDISFGTLYPALKRLTGKGYVTSYPSTHKKNKIIYEITSAGRDALKQWLLTPKSNFKMNYEFLSKLFFYQQFESVNVIDQINNHIEEIDGEIQQMLILEKEFEEVSDFYQKLTLSFGKDFLIFLREWHCKASLKIEEKEKQENVHNNRME